MVENVNNGRVTRWTQPVEKHVPTKSETTSGASSCYEVEQFEQELSPKLLVSSCSWWMQYKLLLMRMLLQMWRDKVKCNKFY